MASKSQSSKPTKRSTPSTGGDSASTSGPKSRSSKPANTLSLIDDDQQKKKRTGDMKTGSAFAPLGSRQASKATTSFGSPSKDTGAPKKSLEQSKKEALNLFDEKENRDNARRRRAEGEAPAPANTGSLLRPISMLRPQEVVPLARAPRLIEDAPVEVAPQEVAEEEVATGERIVNIKPPIVVRDLAERMGLKAFQVIKDLIDFKVFAKPDTVVDAEVAAKICERHGFAFEKEKREKGAGVHRVEEVIAEPLPPPPPTAEEKKDVYQLRAPIITFMGHVDHGKTSLLDAVRKTSVTKSEAGGITQHVGAYSVEYQGRPVTFLDTPGHAAFSGMRARGAQVTDIVVLVVASDDGMMPQTIEALNHAKAAKVTIMVAINKIDLPTANPLRIKQQLQEHGLMPVEWGGETEILEVSATKGIGMDNFMETLSLQAEILDLRANEKATMRATVIESRMDPGRGPVATVIVQAGTLKVGQSFICGPNHGKVKGLTDDRGTRIKEVKPGMPAELVGFDNLPNVGDEVVEMENDRAAKRLSEERQADLRQKKLEAPRRSTLEALFTNIAEGTKKILKVVLKSDVQGSLEAIANSLHDIKSDKVEINVLHAAAGPITDGDILLASASDAVVIGFNVKVENSAVAVARREGVQVKLYSIIYELLDQVKEAMVGLLDPETRERVIGHAKIKMVFKLTRGKVAGCIVTDGRIDRKARARIIRGGQPVFDGSMDTLRRFLDEVPEVRNGVECGIRLANFTDYMEDDIIECYELDKIKREL